MHKNVEYIHNDGKFVIKNYNKSKTFSSFFPGLAGKKGIPLWAFYVNRAQAVSGFGVQDKNHPINLFHPANKAYETVARDGFRTFLKKDGVIHEPFAPTSGNPHVMEIEAHKVAIEETDEDFGVRVRVTYFGLPEATFPALVRRVSIENITDRPLDVEVLDGLAEILPAGVKNLEFKASSNLLQSWMDVNALEDDFAFFKLRGSTGDDVEVNEVTEGHFYLSFDHEGLIAPVVDTQLIFAHDTSKSYPFGFETRTVSAMNQAKQVTKNRVPCAFVPREVHLGPKEMTDHYSLVGHTHSLSAFKAIINDIARPEYVEEKEQRAGALIDELQNDVDTSSGIPVFDAYIRQNYLDNFLRGGYPLSIGDEIYHIYARRHGDLERDYNFFSLSPLYYSTGPGNFRDVCQNRRLDAFIHREVEAFDVIHFASLIQMDGYNPLSVESITYRLDDADRDMLIDKHFETGKAIIREILSEAFTPGDVVNTVERKNIDAKSDETTYLADILNHSERTYEATFGEGYWIDHFTYFLDLVEVYEGMYPDRFEDLYGRDEVCLYFKSPIHVLKQSEKAILTENSTVRQYRNITRTDETESFVRHGEARYQSTLFVKLWMLALNKFAQLDPDGIGVEMEAGKPGWNDAMNGLPGLFGSGVSETIELKRIIDFLKKHGCPAGTRVPRAAKRLEDALTDSFAYEDRVEARETYRDAIRNGSVDELVGLDETQCKSLLEAMGSHINRILLRLFEEEEGLLPTYLTYDVTDYERTGRMTESNGKRELVRPTAFKRRALPTFLEAPARLLKTDFPDSKLRDMVKNIKQSPLYDKKLRQYKTSVPLKHESHEIGRIKAFTPGWLERESNFLHMTYKYLLGLLKAGMDDTFYDELRTNLVCFMEPSVYGRSPLENSSFLATSNNPDPALHGQGFFARLSGSTAEALNMWAIMMIGEKPFTVQNGEVIFSPDPRLHASFFREDGTLAFNFMRDVRIVYRNTDRINTYERESLSVETLMDREDNEIHIEGGVVRGEEAKRIRNGHYKEIHIEIH